MLSSTPWWLIALAVALAVTAAVSFGYGASLQQRAVTEAASRTTGTGATHGGRVGVESFRWLARQPRWLAGWTVIAVGTLLHMVALLLAPVAVVQPIGILAVPVAVVLAARQGRARLGRAVLTGVVLAVAGTGVFVSLAGSAAAVDGSRATSTGLLVALLVVAVVTTSLDVMARTRTGLVRCLGYASIGAVSFGFSSALVHLIGEAAADGSGLLTPVVLIAGLAAATALTVGAWAVQQAYAAGSSAVVIGALTVGDPLVAILLSAGLLGGGLSLTPVLVAAMVGCASASVVGVRLLATHHPAALPAAAPIPARDLVAAH